MKSGKTPSDLIQIEDQAQYTAKYQAQPELLLTKHQDVSKASLQILAGKKKKGCFMRIYKEENVTILFKKTKCFKFDLGTLKEKKLEILTKLFLFGQFISLPNI